MPLTIAFDVYGTLIDTAGVVTALERPAGGRAAEVARLWRDKQLEYSFRRGLMRLYGDGFSQCTREALEYACLVHGVDLLPEERARLLDGYRWLPAFQDAAPALGRLAGTHRLYAFSNGLPQDVDELLRHAGLRGHFLDVVSVHEVGSYKPDPAVYRHFATRSGTSPDGIWLVSGNPFDVIGARVAGWSAAWVRRSPGQVYDPWPVLPSLTVPGLVELADALPSDGAEPKTS